MQLEYKKDLCCVWRSCDTDPTCQRWFAKFHAGDFSLDDVPWSDRPVEDDRDETETFN